MKMHWVTKIAGLLAGVVFSASAMAGPLQNGDFSSGTNGFESWGGELYDGSTSTDLVDDAAFGTYNSFYNASGGAATLTNDETYWSVFLFQSFHVPMTGGTLTLSFGYEWSISDTVNDFVQAQLEDPSGTVDTIGLFDGVALANNASGTITQDITAFAGLSDPVELSFLLEDNWGGGNTTGDWLKISNIMITETLSVPAPPVLMLLLTGLTGLLYRTKRS